MFTGFTLGFDLLLALVSLVYLGRLVVESFIERDIPIGYARCVEKRSLMNQNIAKRKCC